MGRKTRYRGNNNKREELALDCFALAFDSVAKIIVWALTDHLFDRHMKLFLCNDWSVQSTANNLP
jgi:hypothetical protein